MPKPTGHAQAQALAPPYKSPSAAAGNPSRLSIFPLSAAAAPGEEKREEVEEKRSARRRRPSPHRSFPKCNTLR
jgi:hypothetical protein